MFELQRYKPWQKIQSQMKRSFNECDTKQLDPSSFLSVNLSPRTQQFLRQTFFQAKMFKTRI